jgi:hypothetical protein
MKKIFLFLFSILFIQGFAQKGWVSLFDGSNLNQWHTFKKSEVMGWVIENGVLTTDGKGGDLVSNKIYTDFQLEFDFKIEPKGNSGVIYKVIENMDDAHFATYASGPEFQIIDDKGYPAKLNNVQLTGANYDILAPSSFPSNAPGQWNHGTIKVKKNKITHSVNGKKVVTYIYGDAKWQADVAKSKFAKWPYAQSHASGKIALQGHNDRVYFKEIKIKEL